MNLRKRPKSKYARRDRTRVWPANVCIWCRWSRFFFSFVSFLVLFIYCWAAVRWNLFYFFIFIFGCHCATVCYFWRKSHFKNSCRKRHRYSLLLYYTRSSDGWLVGFVGCLVGWLKLRAAIECYGYPSLSHCVPVNNASCSAIFRALNLGLWIAQSLSSTTPHWAMPCHAMPHHIQQQYHITTTTIPYIWAVKHKHS